MKIDVSLFASSDNFLANRLGDARASAAAHEAAGHDGVYVLDGIVDPFLALALAGGATSQLDLVTGVAIALARSPMTTAMQAWNLQDLSRGRLILGLGSQVRAHVRHRFGMPWTAPVSQMREYVECLRAIWACWSGEGPLRYEGEHYRITLMTRNFNPGPLSVPRPTVLMGGLGPRMLETAGEVADGYYGHPFTSPGYVRTAQLPHLQRGRDRAASSGAAEERPFTVVAMPMVATGTTPDDRARAGESVRALIAFYGSTPAYHRVLEHHGHGELGPRLHVLSKQSAWDRMAELVPDDLLDQLAVRGTPEEVGTRLRAEYGYADRLALYGPYKSDPAVWQRVSRAVHDAA